ncbi:MAG: ABC transporter substrate-binding protein [Legionellales bacterium]
MPNILARSNFIFSVLIAFFLGTGMTYATVATQEQSVSPVAVHVGIYAPFSNEHAFIGRNILGAMEMARDQLQDSKVVYSFYTLDEQPDNASASRVLQKFIEAHQIKVLLTDGSSSGSLAAPIVRKNNIIHFSMSSDVSIADGVNNFIAWSPAYEQAAVLVQELKHKHVNRLGVITTNQSSVKALTQSVFKKVLTDSPIKIVAYEQIISGAKDYSGLINKMKKNNADIYLIMAPPRDIEFIQAEMKTAHLNKPITTIVDRVTSEVMHVFNDQWVVDTHEMQPEFIAQFQQAYLNYPVTEAGYAFDVFQILNKSVVGALKTSTNISSQEISKQMHTAFKGVGVMGKFNLDNQGVLYTKSAIKSIHNGQIRTA